MAHNNLLKASEWMDLVPYKRGEIIKELSLPIPWLMIEIWAITNQWTLLSLIASSFFFLTCLRLSHNAFHYSLGLTRATTNVVMMVVSVLMLTSMRATQYTHMLHHRYCLGDKDVEGSIARLPFYEMLLAAPLFSIRLHIDALKHAKAKQKFGINVELSLNVIWIVLVWFWFEYDALKIHTVIMMLCHLVSPFFTVWSVHHDCEISDDNAHNSRTLRHRIMSLVAYDMLYHLEHHYYPAVPTCHLRELACRLDQAGLNNYKTVL